MGAVELVPAPASAARGVAADRLLAAADAPAGWRRRADVLCDGLDDHLDLLAAIAAGPVAGVTIQLSPGTFSFGAAGVAVGDGGGLACVPIARDGVRVRGAGMFATRIGLDAAGAGVDVFRLYDAAGTVTGFELADLTIDGTDGAGGRRGRHGVSLDYSNLCLLERVQVVNLGGSGVKFTDGGLAAGGTLVADGAIAAGSRRLTTAAPHWTGNNADHVVTVAGAGPGGTPLVTRIAYAVSNSVLWLDDAAATTVSGATVTTNTTALRGGPNLTTIRDCVIGSTWQGIDLGAYGHSTVIRGGVINFCGVPNEPKATATLGAPAAGATLQVDASAAFAAGRRLQFAADATRTRYPIVDVPDATHIVLASAPAAAYTGAVFQAPESGRGVLIGARAQVLIGDNTNLAQNRGPAVDGDGCQNVILDALDPEQNGGHWAVSSSTYYDPFDPAITHFLFGRTAQCSGIVVRGNFGYGGAAAPSSGPRGAAVSALTANTDGTTTIHVASTGGFLSGEKVWFVTDGTYGLYAATVVNATDLLLDHAPPAYVAPSGSAPAAGYAVGTNVWASNSGMVSFLRADGVDGLTFDANLNYRGDGFQPVGQVLQLGAACKRVVVGDHMATFPAGQRAVPFTRTPWLLARPGVNYTTPDRLQFFEDFLGGNVSTNAVGQLGWALVGTITNVASTAAIKGARKLDPGGTAAAQANLNLATSLLDMAQDFDLWSLAQIDFTTGQAIYRPVAASNNTGNTAPSGHVAIERGGGDTDWQLSCRNSGVETRTPIGAGLDTNYHYFRLRKARDPYNGSAVTVYASVDGGREVKCTLNVTAGLLVPLVQAVNGAADVNRSMSVDRFAFEQAT